MSFCPSSRSVHTYTIHIANIFSFQLSQFWPEWPLWFWPFKCQFVWKIGGENHISILYVVIFISDLIKTFFMCDCNCTTLQVATRYVHIISIPINEKNRELKIFAWTLTKDYPCMSLFFTIFHWVWNYQEQGAVFLININLTPPSRFAHPS